MYTRGLESHGEGEETNPLTSEANRRSRVGEGLRAESESMHGAKALERIKFDEGPQVAGTRMTQMWAVQVVSELQGRVLLNASVPLANGPCLLREL